MNVMKINEDIYKNMGHIIQKHASIYIMCFHFVYFILLIFVSIICDIKSDKYSHKIPMILSTVVNLFVSIIKYNLSIEILFLSNILTSLSSSTSIMFSTVYNYLSYIKNN